MTTTKMGHNNCPSCDRKLDAATSAYEDAVPTPHDITICLYCGEMLEFSDDMDLQVLPEIIFDTFDSELKENINSIRERILLTRLS